MISFQPIGIVHSPFKEKFAIPRQPGLARAAEATVELLSPYDREEALAGLEQFSHIWLLFVFHQCAEQGWSPTVRPPRLGGNRRLGVFATRSTFRPNPLGMSAVELLGFEREQGKLLLHVRGADLLDGTPIVDIKPYIPYADARPEASGGFAPEAPEPSLEVHFCAEAERALAQWAPRYPGLRPLIEETLGYDPRPAYRREKPADAGRVYGVRLYEFDVKWRVEGQRAVVLRLELLSEARR